MSSDLDRSDPGPVPPPPPRRRGARTSRLLLAMGLIGVTTALAGGAGLWLLFKDRGGGGGVVQDAYLEVKIHPGITDAPRDVGFAFDPADFPLLLTELTADIRAAATDPSVKGLYLEVEGAPGGWAAAQELRDAVAAFGQSGKPCHAWANGYDNQSYYIASACDEVYLAPAGIMLVNGFSITNEYYAGTLAKLGVEADFEHVGDFKTAVEPFERSGPSEAADLAMNEMLDDLYAQMLSGIAAGRGKSVDEVRTMVDAGPIDPQSALQAGLVDGLLYRDQVREEKAGKKRTTARAYHASRSDGGLFAAGRKHIAVVHAEGTITSGKSSQGLFGGQSLGELTMEEIFTELREDEDVAAVVLRVNSPGGSGLASDNIWRQIELTRAAGKPVVVSMGDYAASGGYYIAAPADRIVAQPATLTGSIGVFGGKMNVKGLYEKVGVSLHTWQRGQLANLLSPVSGFSDAERERFRGFLQAFYTVFLDRVATGRKMSPEAVHQVAQGRVWTGAQAAQRGLVDAVGGLDVAISSAKELAGIPAEEEVRVDRYPRRKTFFETLEEDLQPEARIPAELVALPELRESWETFVLLGRVLEDGGVAAMLPGRLVVR